MLYPKKLLLFMTLLLASAGAARAQVGAGAGLGAGFPFLVNRQGYYNTMSVGIWAAVNYQPPYGRLFPSFSYILHELQMPLYSPVASDLNVFARNDNFMLHLNYRTGIERSYWVYSFGLGVANITTPNPNVYSGASTDMTLVDSGSNHLHPALNASIRYVRSLSASRPVYLTLEASLTYISVYPRANEYYISSGTTLTPTRMYGDVLYPHMLAGVYYLFGRRE